MSQASPVVTDLDQIRAMDAPRAWRNYEEAYRAMLQEERASNYFSAARLAHVAHYSETIYFIRVEQQVQVRMGQRVRPSA